MGKTSRLAIISFVMGILGLFIPFIGSLLALAAIILGIISIKQIKKDPNLKGRGWAITAIILGIIAIVLLLVTFILGFGMGGGGFMSPQFGTVEVHTPQVQ